MAELTVTRNYTYAELVTAGEPGNSTLTDKAYKPNRTPAERHIANGYFTPYWRSPVFTGKFSGDNFDVAMITPAIPAIQLSGFSGFMMEVADVLQADPGIVVRIGDTLDGDNIDLTGFYKDLDPAYYSIFLTQWDTLRPVKSYPTQKVTRGGVRSTYFWGLEGNTRAIMPPYVQFGVVLGGTEADATIKAVIYANYL